MLTLALATCVASVPIDGAPRLLDQTLVLARSEAVPGSEQDLEARITELNVRIRATNTDWPAGSLVAAYFGFAFSPSLLVGLPLLLFSAAIGPASVQQVFFIIGLSLTSIGLVGVGLLIAGIVSGLNASNEGKAERDRLVNERKVLEDELRELKRRPDSVQVLPFLAFGF